MKSFLYRAGSTLLCALAVVAMGCQEDNEAAIKQQEAKSSERPGQGPPSHRQRPRKSIDAAAQQYQGQGDRKGDRLPPVRRRSDPVTPWALPLDDTAQAEAFSSQVDLLASLEDRAWHWKLLGCP